MMLVQACESNVSIIMIGASIDWCESTDTQVYCVSKLILYDASMIVCIIMIGASIDWCESTDTQYEQIIS